VVGPLQLDVLRVRLKDEYGLEIMWDVAEFAMARWISSEDAKAMQTFVTANSSAIADDLDGDAVYLARNQFYLDHARQNAPAVKFTDVKDIHKVSTKP
jgi:peptide chain release factor 3